MLTVQDEEYFRTVWDFAETVNATDRLQSQLDHLEALGPDGKESRCLLFPDFAPHSFAFAIEVRVESGEWRRWLHGGLIYSGPGQPLDGSFPALCVSIGPNTGRHHDWTIHT